MTPRSRPGDPGPGEEGEAPLFGGTADRGSGARAGEPGAGSDAAGSDAADTGRPSADEPSVELRRGGRRPLDVRSAALSGLLILAVFYTLYFAQAFLLPVVLAVLFKLLLSPVVDALRRVRVPEGVGAGIVVLGLLALLAGSVVLLLGPTLSWLDRAPASFERVAEKLEAVRGQVAQVSRATQEVERLAGGAAGDEPRTVQLEERSLSASLLEKAQALIAGTAVMLALLYFLLASGDLFLRKLIRVLPTFDDKKRAVDIARALQTDISIYLSSITLINIGLGVAVGVGMHLLGMPNAMLWGVLATVLNFIPYLGAVVGIAVIAVIAALTFDTPAEMVMPPLVYFLLTSTEGYFVTPALLGRRLTLNPVVILLGLIFCGWLWGIAGAVLAVPLLASFKIFCDHIRPLATIGEFLGR